MAIVVVGGGVGGAVVSDVFNCIKEINLACFFECFLRGTEIGTLLLVVLSASILVLGLMRRTMSGW